jgi:uncharacterized Zn finger protein
MHTAIHTLAKVDNERLQRGVEGLTSGLYDITLIEHSDSEVRGLVKIGGGIEYGVVLTDGRAFCSCKDALYRNVVCKHGVALSLYAIRHPQAPAVPVDLKLAKLSPSWDTSMI